MPEIVFTDQYGEAKKSLHQALNAFLAPLHMQLATGSFRAHGPDWELAPLTHTFHQHIYVLCYSQEELGSRLKDCLERHKISESALLWQYPDSPGEYRGLIFSDDKYEGEWAWEQAMREQNFPYLIQFDGEIVEEQIAAWNRCATIYKSSDVDIRTCRSVSDFRVLCGTRQGVDPYFYYVLSGLTNPSGIRRALRNSPHQTSAVHELVRLGQQSGWAYGWTWGGGPGEYHATFWAHDAELSRQLAVASGVHVLGRF